MTVKELINKLLDAPIDLQVELRTVDHIDGNGDRVCKFFKIHDVNNILGIPCIDFIDDRRIELKELVEEKYPNIIGCPTAMYVDGDWKIGIIIVGYRFGDGIVAIEDANGKQYSCSQNRTELYHRLPDAYGESINGSDENDKSEEVHVFVVLGPDPMGSTFSGNIIYGVYATKDLAEKRVRGLESSPYPTPRFDIKELRVIDN